LAIQLDKILPSRQTEAEVSSQEDSIAKIEIDKLQKLTAD